MRGKRHSNVKYVILATNLRKTWKFSHHQFIKERSHSNVKIVIQVANLRKNWKVTYHQFMTERSHLNVKYLILATNLGKICHISLVQAIFKPYKFEKCAEKKIFAWSLCNSHKNATYHIPSAFNPKSCHPFLHKWWWWKQNGTCLFKNSECSPRFLRISDAFQKSRDTAGQPPSKQAGTNA